MTESRPPSAERASLREIFAGRRGRLLAALLAAEFGAAVQGIAYSTVLPVAASELHGAALYGATLAAASLSTIFMLALGPAVLARYRPATTLGIATVAFAVGSGLSALAPTMGWLLVGNVVRGLSAGVIAGFGYAALGALYEDRLRPRVMGLFAVMWLVPSLVGPPVNAALTGAAGWRWAMVWPAVLVVGARVLIGVNAGIIPAQQSSRRVSPWIGITVVAALALASWASAGSGVPGWGGWAVGLIAATVLSVVLFRHAAAGSGRRLAALGAFFGSCFVYFAAESVMPLSLVAALGGPVLAGGAAVGIAGVAWSLVGLWPPRPGRRTFGRAPIGVAVVLLGVAGFGAALLAGPGAGAVGAALAASALIGAGMGLAYTVQSSATFDELDPEHVAPVATATAFAETASVTIGALLTGGSYSLATSGGVAPAPVLAAGFAALAVIAAATVWLTVVSLRPRTRTAAA